MKKPNKSIDWLRAHPIWIVLGILLVVGILWPQPSVAQRAQASAAATVSQTADVYAGSDAALSEGIADAPQPEAIPDDAAQGAQAASAGLWFDADDTRAAEEYTDEELVYWNAGTFDCRQDSLRYHFNRHGEELPAYTVADYLNQAYETRAEVLEDADGWRITQSQGANAAHKYKNYEDSRFIILDDADNSIYSFGR